MGTVGENHHLTTDPPRGESLAGGELGRERGKGRERGPGFCWGGIHLPE